MKKNWGIGAIATLTCGLGLVQFACSSSTQDHPSTEPTADPKLEELIGSVPVSSASLDGIGSIGFVYYYDYLSGGAGAPGGIAGSVSIDVPVSGGSPAASGGAPAIAGGPASGGSSAGAISFAGAGGASPYPSYFNAQCTGTLISKNSVLTSRSCGNLFQQLYYASSLKFAIGPDSTQPKRFIDVVDVEFAPVSVSNGSVTYPDIAVLHLGESVTDVAPFPVALLTDDLIGKQLAAVGFGTSDLRYQSGTRRAGALTLRATSGLLFPAIFGGFDAFYQYELSGGGYPYYPPYGYAGQANVTSGASSASAGSGPVTAGAGGFVSIGGSGGAFGGSGGTFGGSGGTFGGSAGGGDDWLRQYYQQVYDTTALNPGESYLGGTDADAQPCGADQGGPIVRKLQNKVRVFGVFSHTPFGSCDKGGVYASITAASKAFIDAAAQWKDPCTGITANGSCVGTTATRCSTRFEGKRRAVKLDCSLLNQVCVSSATSEVACTDK